MKKLMIVAAVATMAAAVVAKDGYDFNASVKTTQGKYGAQKTSYTVKCGQDDAGTYWWDGLGFDSDREAKAYVKALTNEEKADFAVDELGFDPTRDDNEGQNDYGWPEFYRGKATWCYTFKFTVLDEDCYRVAGSRKLKGVVSIDDCCDGTWEFEAPVGAYYSNDFGLADGTEITPVLLYRFGGVSLEKANKVEFAGEIQDFATLVSDECPEDQNFALAGQGAWDGKLNIIKNINGNIVGILENPDCETCCDYSAAAIVFECPGYIGEYQDEPEGTACFGTWNMKYNKKYVFAE